MSNFVVIDDVEVDYEGRLLACQSSFDVFKVFKEICIEFDYRSFMIRRLPCERDEFIRDLVILSNWPPELLNAYDDKKFLRSSPFFLKLRNTTVPFEWDMDTVAELCPGDHGNTVKQLFKNYGHFNGVHIPASDIKGTRFVISFVGDRKPLQHSELVELVYFATCANDRLNVILEPDSKRVKKFSEREIQCLSWSASGKTCSEIAVILELSANTVNHYISSASKKLGCVNKTHAVARAIFDGVLIDESMT